jgi:hypothetical protein
MKTNTFFLLFLITVYPLIAVSQSFVIDFKTTEDEICVGFVENPQGGYFVSILRGTYQESDPAMLEYRNIVYKMDDMGNLTDSVTFEDTDSLNFAGGTILLSGEDVIITSTVFAKNDMYNNRALRITTLNFNLDIIDDMIYSKPGYYLWPGAINLDNNGCLIMAVNQESISTGEYYPAVVRLNLWNGIWFFYEKPMEEPLPMQSVAVLPGINGYLFCDINRIALVNNNLNYKGILYQHEENDELWFIMSSFKPLNDSSCIVTGWKPWDPFNAAWSVLNIDGTWEDQHDFGISGINDHAGGADFVSTDNIYISRAAEMEGYIEWSLYNFKLDGTENWHHNDYTYKGYHFSGFGAYATSDNSCVIMGRYQTENSSGNEYDLVFMKLNEDGSVTGLGESDVKTDISLYPNPGKDKIYVDGQVAGCKVSLFDCAGRLVFNKQLENNDAVINVCELMPGFYSYRIDSKSTTISGKWIKIK